MWQSPSADEMILFRGHLSLMWIQNSLNKLYTTRSLYSIISGVDENDNRCLIHLVSQSLYSTRGG